jgi:hypothetical protein
MEDSGESRSGSAGEPPELAGEVAELVGEVTQAPARTGPRRVAATISRISGRGGHASRNAVLSGGRASRRGVASAGRWLTTQVLAMAPRLPVRDLETLRAQHPGLDREELAGVLIRGAAHTTAAVGAATGAALVLPLPSAPVEVAVETLAVVGIEIKLVAELHEVYGERAPGTATERMLSYVGAWAQRRGISFAPAGIVLVAGSPLRRRLQRRLLARASRSALSLGPLLTGAVAGAVLNQHETNRLGAEVRKDLRSRLPQAMDWPD